jgi:hypothetical protein
LRTTYVTQARTSSSGAAESQRSATLTHKIINAKVISFPKSAFIPHNIGASNSFCNKLILSKFFLGEQYSHAIVMGRVLYHVRLYNLSKTRAETQKRKEEKEFLLWLSLYI